MVDLAKEIKFFHFKKNKLISHCFFKFFFYGQSGQKAKEIKFLYLKKKKN